MCLIIDFIDGGLVEVEGWDFEAEKVIGKGYISFAAMGSAGFKRLKLGRMREVMRWRRDIFVGAFWGRSLPLRGRKMGERREEWAYDLGRKLRGRGLTNDLPEW